MREAGRRKVEAQYSQKVIAGQLLRVLQEVASPGSAQVTAG